MATDFDRLVEELQQQIIEQARAVYSDKVIEEFYHPKNLGGMHEPDAHAIRRGWCGDTMEIYVRLKGDKIEKATFMTDGCGPTVACGSVLTQMVTGMSLVKASQVRAADLVVALDGSPRGEPPLCRTGGQHAPRRDLLSWRSGSAVRGDRYGHL